MPINSWTHENYVYIFGGGGICCTTQILIINLLNLEMSLLKVVIAHRCLQCGRPGFDPWVGKIPWRRKWQSTPVLLPGKSHGQRSQVGYSSWGRKESDTTERLNWTKSRSQQTPSLMFSTLAWKIPWTEEPGRLQSMGSRRVGHNWSNLAAATAARAWYLEGHGDPLQYSCLENSMDRGAWQIAVHRVAQSCTWLKGLSTHAYKDMPSVWQSTGYLHEEPYLLLEY